MIDEILEDLYANGRKRYHLVYFTSILTGMLAGAFVLYSIYYFEIRPRWDCLYEYNNSIFEQSDLTPVSLANLTS